MQMIYSRFVKYLTMLKRNRRPAIRDLCWISASDVRTTTGGNVRTIFLKSGMDPRLVPQCKFADWRVYEAKDKWTVPLVSSLLLLRSDDWVVNFDLDEEECLGNEDIKFIYEALCTG